MSGGNIVTASRVKYFEIFIFGLSVMFGIFVIRPVLVPHERSIAPAMPRIGIADLQQFGKGSSREEMAVGESLYRAGDKRLVTLRR